MTITSQTIHVDSGYDSDYTDFVYDVYDERDSYGSTAANGAHGGANAALGAAESHLSANLSSDSHYTAGTWGSSESSWHFDLTPSTGVLFNASGNAGVAASDIVSSYAFSYHEFRGSLGDSANGSNQFRQYFDLSTWGLSGAQSLSGDFVLSGYLHTDKRAESGSFEFSHRNSVSLYGPTPAVPEPETYAMLLAGLALVGAGARRRARRAGG
nr:PEP-CTERM sorting domain-containing protein [Massilia genomosp. 1]